MGNLQVIIINQIIAHYILWLWKHFSHQVTCWRQLSNFATVLETGRNVTDQRVRQTVKGFVWRWSIVSACKICGKAKTLGKAGCLWNRKLVLSCGFAYDEPLWCISLPVWGIFEGCTVMLSLVGGTQTYSSFLEHNCPRRGCLSFHLYHFLLKNKTNKKKKTPTLQVPSSKHAIKWHRSLSFVSSLKPLIV